MIGTRTDPIAARLDELERGYRQIESALGFTITEATGVLPGVVIEHFAALADQARDARTAVMELQALIEEGQA